MEIISSSHWGILEFLHIIFEFKRHYFFCNWICSLLIMYNHGKYCIFNKIMRVLRYTILYPSFLESALHIDDRMEIILVWNCGGLIIVIIAGLSINSKAWQNLAHFGTEIIPMCFVLFMNVCDGVPYVWFYLGTTESMAERNIFSARSRFGFQGNVTKEMWSHVHMKRSRRHILVQHLRHITKMKNKIGNRCQNKQTAALLTWLQYYIVSSFESWKTSP